MHKNPLITLVIGLMIGLAVGYMLAERQPIPPGKAMQLAAPPQGGGNDGLPEGHPPLDGGDGAAEARFFQERVAELQGLMAQNPDDPGLMVSMGDSYFELGRVTGSQENWRQSKSWYEKAMAAGRGDDPNVLTDLAVVHRNLGDQTASVELLERAVSINGSHWQAWFNLVVIRNFDLHDHDGAKADLLRLKEIAADNPQVPDLTQLEHEVMGHSD